MQGPDGLDNHGKEMNCDHFSLFDYWLHSKRLHKLKMILAQNINLNTWIIYVHLHVYQYLLQSQEKKIVYRFWGISLSKGLPYPWESSSTTILLPCTAQRQNSILMVTGELLYTSQKLTQATRPVHIIFYRTL